VEAPPFNRAPKRGSPIKGQGLPRAGEDTQRFPPKDCYPFPRRKVFPPAGDPGLNPRGPRPRRGKSPATPGEKRSHLLFEQPPPKGVCRAPNRKALGPGAKIENQGRSPPRGPLGGQRPQSRDLRPTKRPRPKAWNPRAGTNRPPGPGLTGTQGPPLPPKPPSGLFPAVLSPPGAPGRGSPRNQEGPQLPQAKVPENPGPPRGPRYPFVG